MPQGMGIGELLERPAALEAKVIRLQVDIARLKAENIHLGAENACLKAGSTERRYRLARHSNNNHKPPSSDGYRKKPRRTSATYKREKRSQGRQKEHWGRTLRQVAQPGKIQIHLPHHCAICGRKIHKIHSDEPHRVISKPQMFGLPEPKPEITDECKLNERTGENALQKGHHLAEPVEKRPVFQALHALFARQQVSLVAS